MSGKYVAPALRGHQVQKREPTIVEISVSDHSHAYLTAKEIYLHFHPSTQGLTLGGTDIGGKADHTLHDASETPGQLAYVLIHPDCCALWENHTSVLVKSNLNMLPASNDGFRKTWSSTRDLMVNPELDVPELPLVLQTPKPVWSSVPVFKRVIGQERGFKLEGWFDIQHWESLPDHAPELMTMLQEKWSNFQVSNNRSGDRPMPNSWLRKLNQSWARVELVRDATRNHETISITRIEHSVSDMLEYMRRQQSLT